MDAENTFRVFDRLWTSGQLSEQDIRSLPGMGIDVVVNLALPTSSNALSGEAECVTALGLTYIQIPVEWERPRPDQFTQFAAVLDANGDRGVWVHCAKNMRVSVFVYLYRRIVLGDDEQAASFPMREVWTPDGVWRSFIEDVLAGRGQSG